MPQTAKSPRPSYRLFLKAHPILGIIGIVVFLNWFVSAFLNAILGGDALGTFPSKDGFMLNSHGHHTSVSEPLWLFSLYYAGATVTLTPIILLIVASRLFARGIQEEHIRTKCLLCTFIVLFLLTWETSIFRSIYQSWEDWSHL